MRDERPKRTDKPQRQAKDKPRQTATDKPWQQADDMDFMKLEGRNSVAEALNAGQSIDRLLVMKEPEGSLRKIIAQAREKGILIQEMTKERLNEISETGKHQGVIAYTTSFEYCDIQDMLDDAAAKNEKPFIVLLDGITDPYNLGAIVRTASAVGAHGIIIPKRRSASVNGIVVKSSAGATAYVKIAKVSNITRTIEELQAAGLWIACADMQGDSMYKASLDGALGIVIGNEGSGVSRLVKEKCDFAIGAPIKGEVKSLNASVAAAVIMYEAVRQRLNN